MMNKENLLEPSEALSEEQRARISQKFRAAKALLARKKPRVCGSSPIPVSHRESIPYITSISRTPLKEVDINTNPSFQLNELRPSANHTKAGRTSLPDTSPLVGPSPASHVKKTRSPFDGESFNTPICPPVGKCEYPSASDCSSSLTSLLDEDFDDCILQQIDAIVEEHSDKKPKRQELDSYNDTQKRLLYVDDIEDKSSEEPLKTPFGSTSELNALSMHEDGNEASTMPSEEILGMPHEYSKYIQSLNSEQRQAACSEISVPLVVVAGPGSGKTSTMVGRVLMLLNKGVKPSEILAMTFTTAAASEMRDRVGTVAGKEISKELNISTFHSFSLQLCRSHAEKLGYTPEFLIYGHGQQRKAVIEALRMQEALQDRPVSPSKLKDKAKRWQKFVTQAKASGSSPEDFHCRGDQTGAALLTNYNNTLRSCNALDYHDLINGSVKLLSEFPEVLEESQHLWKAVIVDEFQDTSAMQYRLLKLLTSHGCITVVGDEDQSIFSFNGADVSGFDSFRKDFPGHKEIGLKKNYRSTRSIIEAASAVIEKSTTRRPSRKVVAANPSVNKVIIKECNNEDAQCSFIVDKILEYTSECSESKCSLKNIAVLYRRQVSGRVFQSAFRIRKIPFNVHGVAFYRKKVIKAIISMLRTTLPGCDDGPFRQVFKVLLPFEKEEKKKMIEHIDKISTIQKCSFISAASCIFQAKISGTFKRSQLSQGRKVISTLEMISKLVLREESMSAVITSVANMLPQRYLLEKKAVVDVEDGKLLNEENDLRSVLQYLIDDVDDFVSTKFVTKQEDTSCLMPKKGCSELLKAFIDYLLERERENFRSIRRDNEDSVTLTTIHQSKGLEWDIVFVVKVNDSEIPLLHEHNGIVKEKANSIEEERRLLYVAMTRARRKLYLSYVVMDTNWQMLQPSRFLRDIPGHLLEVADQTQMSSIKQHPATVGEAIKIEGPSCDKEIIKAQPLPNQMPKESSVVEDFEENSRNYFLRRFNVEDRGTISRLFHQWAKKQAFQDGKRLLNKVRFVIDERLRMQQVKNKEGLQALKSCLGSDEAFQFAQSVVRYEQIPADQRAQITSEKQQHFQKLRMESVMNTSAPSDKQIAYLHSLGCTVVPENRLHASRLIEQYKSL